MSGNHFIERARALDKAATAGPWEWEPEHIGKHGDEYHHPRVYAVGWAGYPVDDVTEATLPANSEDAEFIAASRSMLPAAVEALARVRELHTPTSMYFDGSGAYCVHCDGNWPCETYQATEVEA